MFHNLCSWFQGGILSVAILPSVSFFCRAHFDNNYFLFFMSVNSVSKSPPIMALEGRCYRLWVKTETEYGIDRSMLPFNCLLVCYFLDCISSFLGCLWPAACFWASNSTNLHSNWKLSRFVGHVCVFEQVCKIASLSLFFLAVLLS